MDSKEMQVKRGTFKLRPEMGKELKGTAGIA